MLVVNPVERPFIDNIIESVDVLIASEENRIWQGLAVLAHKYLVYIIRMLRQKHNTSDRLLVHVVHAEITLFKASCSMTRKNIFR